MYCCWRAAGWWIGSCLVLTSMVMAEVKPERLRCEFSDNPLGIDHNRPRLSWVLKSEGRGQYQTAYQILVADTEEDLNADRGDMWDSGKVASKQMVHIVYAGKPLVTGQRVYWKVRAWNKDDKPSPYSDVTWWEMGLTEPGDWKGQWICRNESLPERLEDFYKENPAPLFRKEFTVSSPIKSARAYVSGLGFNELRLNGKKAGDRVLDPAWTTYSKRVLYSTYDVADMLKQGANAVGIMVGNGWYNPLPMKMWGAYNLREFLTVGRPRAILQLNIEYVDGTRQSVVTDTSWKVGNGPILKNSVYLGELYDGRLEQEGWDTAGFDDGKWSPAVVATEPIGAMKSQVQPPVKMMPTIKPVKISEPRPGMYIFDLGRNFAGWARLKVKGPAGTKVTLRYGELLYPDGMLNVMTSVAGQIKSAGTGGPGAPEVAWQSDTYICKGDGDEVYMPRFTFHGFRYVEVTGYPGKPGPEAIEGVPLSAAVQPVGTFSCSNTMFNRIQEMVQRTLLSNLFGVQSDCPHREKFGYGGDIMVSSEMAMFNFDMAGFYIKTIHDYEDTVHTNGGMTETAPFVGIDAGGEGFGDGIGPIGWGTVHPFLQWQLYQYYGDLRLMQKQYPLTKRWIQFLESRAKDHIMDNGISDHESLVPKPRVLTGTAFYYYNVLLLSWIAKATGQEADAEHYANLAQTIKTAFNHKFLKSGTGRFDIATQAAQSFALYLDLVPPSERAKAFEVLIDDIMTAHKGHLTTGIFGTKYMLNTLTDLGRVDVAYTIVNQKDFPGWGHMLESGATTLWEHWEFSDNTYSHNHPMFGSVSEWFFKAIAGINPLPEAVGFDKVMIRPHVVGDLTWAKGDYNSVRGHVVCNWRVEGESLLVDVAIPAGVTAAVHLPAKDPKTVTEGGQPIGKAEGVEVVSEAEGLVICKVGSGEYKFAIGRFVRSGQ